MGKIAILILAFFQCWNYYCQAKISLTHRLMPCGRGLPFAALPYSKVSKYDRTEAINKTSKPAIQQYSFNFR